jgi:HAD superfamily hydrolase (TIGR01484 family)
MYMQISAILSDYDGTLCPTTSIRSEESVIPEELQNILWDISEKIPICIISSKHFDFLHSKTRFASVVSCILGIETLVLKRHKKEILTAADSKEDTLSDSISECKDIRCIKSNYLLVGDNTLQYNSETLSQLAKEIASNFKEVSIEHKFTSYKKMLAGITIDWRHIDDWKFFKVSLEPRIREVVVEKQRELQQDGRSDLHIQTYTTHPFLDIYAAKCDKGVGYESILSQIPFTKRKRKKHAIMYLGDSENDNPAFRKADVSIGVKSDERLNPNLDCKYTVKFDKLAALLEKLHNDNFVFSGL